jgi:hypothetical protein
MSIEKKSLISTLQSTKKANIAKERGASDVSKTPGVKNPIKKFQAVKKGAAKTSAALKAGAAKMLIK